MKQTFAFVFFAALLVQEEKPVQRPGPVFIGTVLENGLGASFEMAPERKEVEINLLFKGGLLAETPDIRGVANLVLGTFCLPESDEAFQGLQLRAESYPEYFRLILSVKPQDLDRAFLFLTKVVWEREIDEGMLARWKSNPRPFGAPREANAERERFWLGEFQKRLLDRSGYVALLNERTAEAKDIPLARARQFRRDYFHPRNGVMLMMGARQIPRLGSRLEETLGRYKPSFFSSSFSVVEELPHASDQSFVFDHDGEKAQAAWVIPAPARGSSDWDPFLFLWKFLEDRFPGRVRAWSGLGTGFLWVHRELPAEKAQEEIARFCAEMKGAIAEFRASLGEGKKPLAPAPIPFEKPPDPRRIALWHFWGWGAEESTQAQENLEKITASDIERSLSVYAGANYLFVAWPASRKKDWPGFPEPPR